MPTIQDRFVMRRGLAANLASVNEVPLQGEWILTLDAADDAHRLKIGDGVTHYNDLSFLQTGGSAGGAGGVNIQTGTAYTFVLGDDGVTVIGTNSGATTFTIPTNAAVAFSVGAKVAYTQGAAGLVTVIGDTGVTVHATNGNTTGEQWDGGVAEKIGTDEWQLWNGPALGPLATAADAPSDSTPYSRQNGGWVSATGGGGGGITAMNEQTGTSYTLVLGDATKAIRITNGSACALTIPPHASVAIPVLSSIPVFQGDAGAVTVTAGAGVTLESPNGVATTALGDFRTLFQRATDIWVIG